MIGLAEADWADIKDKDFSLVVTSLNQRLLNKIGYEIDKDGFLIDAETKKRVEAEDGQEINIRKEKNISLIGGSHTFVRDVAGYSQYLARKGEIKIVGKGK